MRIILSTFGESKRFVDHFDITDTGKAVLSLDTKTECEKDEEVILELRFSGLRNTVLLRACYLGTENDKVCFAIHDSYRDTVEFLLALSSGEVDVSWNRTHRRFPVRLEADVSVDEDNAAVKKAHTENIAQDGLHLKVSEPLPKGAKISVTIRPKDGSDEIKMESTVVWSHPGNPEEGVSPRVGVRFEHIGGADGRRMRQLVRKIKGSGEVQE